MATARLTKRTVDAAMPQATRCTLFDADLTGYGLRVSPSGQKSYVVEYRAGERGRRAPKRRVTLGSTTTLTPDKARELLNVAQPDGRPGDEKPAGETEPPVLARICPCCGGHMIIIETFERGCQPRYQPRYRPPPVPVRIDTS